MLANSPPLSVDKPVFSAHSVDRLRAHHAAQSTRVFNARGVSVKRCAQCLLGEQTCVCQWRAASDAGNSAVDWVLLLHRDEIFKPTNTGRLIADLFPKQSHAFCWDRTQPDSALLALLQDPKRRCFIIFPSDDNPPRNNQPRNNAPRESILPTIDKPFQAVDDERKVTLILLDGTWKQARKMYRQSQWLAGVPLLDLKHILASEALSHIGNYRVRKAVHDGQLATCEAAAAALKGCGQDRACEQLLDYFSVFNEHYIALRMNRTPLRLEAHRRILKTATQSLENQDL